jgi:hypothetical protein
VQYFSWSVIAASLVGALRDPVGALSVDSGDQMPIIPYMKSSQGAEVKK